MAKKRSTSNNQANPQRAPVVDGWGEENILLLQTSRTYRFLMRACAVCLAIFSWAMWYNNKYYGPRDELKRQNELKKSIYRRDYARSGIEQKVEEKDPPGSYTIIDRDAPVAFFAFRACENAHPNEAILKYSLGEGRFYVLTFPKSAKDAMNNYLARSAGRDVGEIVMELAAADKFGDGKIDGKATANAVLSLAGGEFAYRASAYNGPRKKELTDIFSKPSGFVNPTGTNPAGTDH